jgi:hypothetical protein
MKLQNPKHCWTVRIQGDTRHRSEYSEESALGRTEARDCDIPEAQNHKGRSSVIAHGHLGEKESCV